MHQPLVSAVALAVGLVACVTDVRSRRVPNLLTFGAAAAALGYHGWSAGGHGLALAGSGWLVGALLFMPFFLLGGMGAGDVKLLAALGAWLGPGDVLWLAIYTSLAGGALGVAVALRRRYLRTALRNIRGLVQYWRAEGLRPAPGLTLDDADAPRLAYAIPILAGTLVTLWLQ